MNLTTSLGSYQPALSQIRQGHADPIYFGTFPSSGLNQHHKSKWVGNVTKDLALLNFPNRSFVPEIF